MSQAISFNKQKRFYKCWNHVLPVIVCSPVEIVRKVEHFSGRFHKIRGKRKIPEKVFNKSDKARTSHGTFTNALITFRV